MPPEEEYTSCSHREKMRTVEQLHKNILQANTATSGTLATSESSVAILISGKLFHDYVIQTFSRW